MIKNEPGIALLSDFGANSLYTGQMEIVLREQSLSSTTPIVDLISDLPQFRPDLASYLIPPLVRYSASSWLFICVVDPGVGSQRAALALKADGRWFVGPDNGILSRVAHSAVDGEWWSIPTPGNCCATFHGRDLFAPLALQIISKGSPSGERVEGDDLVGVDWPSDLHKVIYSDHYGNLMTGIRAEKLSLMREFSIGKYLLKNATTFSDLPVGEPFWYKNSLGLVEFSANMARADQLLGLAPGDALE